MPDISFVPLSRLTQPQGNRQARVLDEREFGREVYFMPMSNPPAKCGSRFVFELPHSFSGWPLVLMVTSGLGSCIRVDFWARAYWELASCCYPC